MLCHVFWSQVEYKIVCFISVNKFHSLLNILSIFKTIIFPGENTESHVSSKMKSADSCHENNHVNCLLMVNKLSRPNLLVSSMNPITFIGSIFVFKKY